VNFRTSPLIALLMLSGAGSVSAQSVSPSKHDALYVTFSAAAGYDDNVLTTDASVAAPKALAVTSFDPRLNYAWGGKRMQFDASVGSNLRYSGTSRSVLGNAHYGAVGFSGGSARTRVSLNQSVNYSSAYLSGLFPAAAPGVPQAAASGNYGVSGQRALFSHSDLRIDQSLSRRARVSALGSYSTQGLSSMAPSVTMRGYTAGGLFSFDLARQATLRAGYVHREGNYSSGHRTVVHDVDLGIDYRRALSLSRRTHASFAVSSSIVDTPAASVTSAASLTYRLGGTATLTHAMGRTWRLGAEYRRDVDILEAVVGPVFSDGVSMTLAGLLTRRTDLDLSAAYSRGHVGATSNDSNRLQTYTATARLRRAVGRRLAVYGEYRYYKYGFGSNVAVIGAIPRTLDRTSAQAGITLWLPVIRK
jgi:hypothetical protein